MKIRLTAVFSSALCRMYYIVYYKSTNLFVENNAEQINDLFIIQIANGYWPHVCWQKGLQLIYSSISGVFLILKYWMKKKKKKN